MGDDKPDPEAFRAAMRMGEDKQMRVDDFVGSYSNTGRVKHEKKWTPHGKPDKDDNVFRSDDWMGSGKTQRKSWAPKSSTNVVKADEASKPGDFVSPNSATHHKWKPPSKNEAIPPPWMGSPTQSSPKRASTAAKWQPRSPPPAPVNASDHTKSSKESSTHGGEMSLSDLQHSNHSHVKDAIERLSNSFSQNALTSSPRHSPTKSPTKRAWQSHGTLPTSSLPKVNINDHDGSDEEYEVASGDNVEAKPKVSSPAPTLAAGYVVGVDGPDPEQFKVHMRTVHAGEDSAFRHNDFVGSYSNTGRVKHEKKWTPHGKPDKEDNAFRSDEWMGSGKTQKKTWKPKSPTKNVVRADDAPKPDFVRAQSENARHWAPHLKKEEVEPEPVKKEEEEAPAPAPAHVEPEHSESAPAEDEEYEVASGDEAVAAPAAAPAAASPAPALAAGYVVGVDGPDPEQFKVHMRTVHAGEDSAFRHNDFVGSYSNTGRVKHEKKWTPHGKPDKEDNVFRSDDWMGSGKTQRKSWVPKTSKNVVRADDAPKPDFVRAQSENARHWAPHLKKEEVEPEPVKKEEEEAPAPAPAHVEPEHSESAPAEDEEHEVASGDEAEVAPAATSAAAAPAPVLAAGYVVGVDGPDPEQFKVHMRTVHAGEDSAFRHDDFVGSYNHTGRVKHEKKWTHAKPDEGDTAFRSDEWMGSGKTQKKSWKVKN